MEIDITKNEAEFISDALWSLIDDGFPEYADFAEKFSDILDYCMEVGTTMHINFKD